MNEQHPQIDEAGMRMALRGLRRDIEPEHDLWPRIAASLQSLPQQASQASRRSRPGWLWPIAMAASLLLAVGMAWQFKPIGPTTAIVPQIAQAPAPAKLAETKLGETKPGETLIQREADNMTVHYESALRQMQVESLPAGWQPGLDALDRSALEIRTAMQHDPNSRLLLERLRVTYSRRLVLARRALYA